ncbi:Gfo/Idh/MocA family protein [Alicyclobacillus herbarius]|uniref:Gfo/Idh/MocA family protein n=1 Tax=Alicyclobacillus herbarius TaxID=122960 RepID=UPI002352E433|nr:Gfo/Idh/MocA family oxidoreductase [Alicyclobacillus herbarius]
MVEMASVRFVMIGVGGMGRAHIQRLLAVPEAEIVALVDPSEPAIRAARSLAPQLADVPGFTSLESALATVEADAAVIVTPHSQHFEQGMACLDHGLHVLMEKPFVAGSENARRLIEAAKERGLHMAVSYQRHTEGPYLYLKRLIAQGELGEIRFISAYQAQSWLESTRGTWRQNKALSCGGQLNDSGSHLLDVVLWLTGLTPQAVLAQVDNRGTEVDIDSALTVQFVGGAMATFSIVGSANIGWWEDVSIHGNKGSALYRNGELFVSIGHNQPLRRVETEDLPQGSNPDADFVDLIQGRVASAAAPAECGYQVARLTEAAWQSAKRQAWVPFVVEERVSR